MVQFEVLVKVSRRSVALWYRTAGKPSAPLLVKGSPEVPLYFWIDGHQFHFGAMARDRFFQHDPNAFGDYFELAKDPARHFVLQNSPKRAKQLLYYGIEQCLSYFLQSVLYQSDAIESYRRTFPLKFIFEPDLNGPEQVLVVSLFTEAGYRMVSVWNHRDMLLVSLGLTHQATLLLTGFDQTLYLDLYPAGEQVARERSELPGQGADPRIRSLAEMIVDYIDQAEPHLGLDKGIEVPGLLGLATQLLVAGSGPILKGEAELSDGRPYWFRVNLNNLADRLLYQSGDLALNTAIGDLLQRHQLRSTDIRIILASPQIDTAYFLEKLRKHYPQVQGLSETERDAALNLIFDQVAAVPPPGPPDRPLPPQLPEVPKKPVLPPPAPAKPPLPAARKPVLPPPLPPPKKKE